MQQPARVRLRRRYGPPNTSRHVIDARSEPSLHDLAFASGGVYDAAGNNYRALGDGYAGPVCGVKCIHGRGLATPFPECLYKVHRYRELDAASVYRYTGTL